MSLLIQFLLKGASLCLLAGGVFFRSNVAAQEVPTPKVFSAYSKMLKRDVEFSVDLDVVDKTVKSPAVVLLHGCGGFYPSKSPMNWRSHFRKQGIATLIVDSFKGRDWGTNVCDKQKETGIMGQIDRVAEAYAASTMLSSLPFIDPNKIFVMGFSHGAGAVLLASVDEVKAFYANTPYDLSRPPYAGVIANYPWCGREDKYPTITMKSVISLPMLLLIGENDNYTPVEYCEKMAARPAFANSSVFSLKVLKGAQHGFDNGLSDRSFKTCGGRGLAPMCQELVSIGHSEPAFVEAQGLVKEFMSRISKQ
jgi:dienelactone hydrolase